MNLGETTLCNAAGDVRNKLVAARNDNDAGSDRCDDILGRIAAGCPRYGRRGRPLCGRKNASDVPLRE